MKQAFSFMAMLLFCTIAMAQESVKIAAHFNKGDYVIYEVETTSKVSNAMETSTQLRQLSEFKYEVTDKRPDGYTIEYNTLKWDVLEGNDNSVGEITDMLLKTLKANKVVYQTDIDGKIIKIVNFDELKEKVVSTINEMFDNILKDMGQENPLDMEKYKSTLLDELTEESFMESMNSSFNAFSLYGKTIATGMMEDERFSGVNLKTTYVVLPSKGADTYTVKSSSVSNMNEDDMVKRIISQAEKIMPKQAEMLKENIDMIKQTGLLKIDAKRQSTFVYQKNGWLKSGETSMTLNMMGNNTDTSSTFKIKESNLK